LRSSSFAAGLSPALSSASGVSNATWWQAAQSALTRSPALYAVHGLRGSGVDPNQRTRQRRETMFADVGSAIRCDGSPLQSGRLRCSKTPDDPLWPIGSPVSLCAIR
jgi:hypothetical protein